MKYAALFILFAAACSSDTSAGVQVTVVAAEQNLPTSITNSTGVTVQTSHAFVTIGAVDITACSSTAARIWRMVNPLPSAFAHSESSPFHMGTPNVVSLAGQRDAVTAGTIAPPPGDYCSVTLEISEADDDAIGIDAAPDMVDNSYVARGSAGANNFDVTSAATDSIVMPIAKLTLDEAHLDATITYSVDTSHIYDGIDFTSATLASDLVHALHGAFSITVTRP